MVTNVKVIAVCAILLLLCSCSPKDKASDTPRTVTPNSEAATGSDASEVVKQIRILENKADDGKFVCPIEDVFDINDVGIVLTGRVERGKVSKGDVVQVIGFGEKHLVTVEDIVAFRESLEYAVAGDNIGIQVDSKWTRSSFERGQVAVTENAIDLVSSFKCKIYWLTEEEGGLSDEFNNSIGMTIYLRTAGIAGNVSADNYTPGADCTGAITLSDSIAVEVGQTFAVRLDGRTIGVGYVTDILE